MPMRPTRSQLSLLALLLATPIAPSQETASRSPVRLEFRVSPVLELYQELRAEAAEPAPEGDPLAAPVSAARALHQQLGSFLQWGPVDGGLGECLTAQDLRAVFAALPEVLEVPRPAGQVAKVPLRELALELADAIVAVEADWLERVWPERAERLEAAAERLAATLDGPVGTALFQELCRAQRMQLDGERVPVVLVTKAPWPGAVTFRRPGGGGLCVVSLGDLEHGLLMETVVHESIHALDVATMEQATLLQVLRSALTTAGFDRRDRRAADTVHALLFLHAAELVRRHLDPEHVDYGEREGVYARLGAPIEVERALFRSYLDGELEHDQLIAGIVAALR
jgi:hypothetical protein